VCARAWQKVKTDVERHDTDLLPIRAVAENPPIVCETTNFSGRHFFGRLTKQGTKGAGLARRYYETTPGHPDTMLPELFCILFISNPRASAASTRGSPTTVSVQGVLASLLTCGNPFQSFEGVGIFAN
jgi:hypothetical protein